MDYKSYPTRLTEHSRKNRKHAKQSVYLHNRGLHSSRTKKGEVLEKPR